MTSRRAFELLVQQTRSVSIPANNKATRCPPGLSKRLYRKKEDHPNINFWTRKNYDDSRNQNQNAAVIIDGAAETTGLPYMEHDDGTPLTEEETVKMRATGR